MNKLVMLLLLALTSIHSAVSESCFNNGTLRLVQTRSINLGNAGRVEICMNGVWGTIAADSVTTPWSEKNAQVACIQLGFSGALNAVFQKTIPLAEHADASVPVHLVAVECTGVERNITQCRHGSVNNFIHENDAYVVCWPNRTVRYSDVHRDGVQSGDIRLFGNTIDSSGAVQIYSSTYGWQVICPDSSWTDIDAETICNELGYEGGIVISPISSSVGPGGEPVSRRLYNTACPGEAGSRSTFGVCSFSVGASNTSNCDQPSGLYASLNCNQMGAQSVRLIGGGDTQEGIVEMVYDGRWGMLCDDGFSRIDAQAICQGLGYDRDAASVLQLSSSSVILNTESNLRPIWLTQLACIASHVQLYQCVQDTNIIGYADCSGSNIAAVDCGDPPGSLDSGQIYGIVFAVLIIIFVICPFIYVFGKGYWSKRHTYNWYNTLTTPSSWFSGGSNRRTWQPPRTVPVTSAATGNSGNTTTFDLHSQNPEPEPSSNEQSDPSLSKAPPPSYQAASNFPIHDPSADLPPPYPGRPELAYPPPFQPTTSTESPPYLPTSTAPPAEDQPTTNGTAYPPPLPGVDYQGYPLPSYPSGPPPPSNNSTTELPYPSDSNVSSNPVHPVSTAVTTSRTINMSVDSASDGASVGSGGSGGDGD